MLIECGYARATAPDGAEWTFAPSLSRIAGLGSPEEIVKLFADLHGPRATSAATYVLICLCEQDDTTSLLGYVDEAGGAPGAMPAAERVIIAKHLMTHGVCGTARPGGSVGSYSPRFDAAEHIAAARVHLGMSAADAEALSMTELQMMIDVKFPDRKDRQDMPTREEHDASVRALRSRNG